MINTDPNRTPTFVMFGNPDFFFDGSNCAGGATQCASAGFAWNHGDIQQEIGNTWVGFVGPGVANHGIDGTTWTDHANVRPTLLSLVGLKDDYEQDGHVLVQALKSSVTPPALRDFGKDTTIAQLEQAEDLVNAPFGTFSKATLAASTFAIESTNEDTYNSIENQISALTDQRNTLATRMKNELYHAAVSGTRIDETKAQAQIAQANTLIAEAAQLSSG
jgi:hypothetical protein